MNLFPASGQQSTTIDNVTLTKYVKKCEKCEKDLIDTNSILQEQKLVIETLDIRILELEDTQNILKESVSKIKIAYNDIVRSEGKKKFWVWIKGALVGFVVGAATVVTILLVGA